MPALLYPPVSTWSATILGLLLSVAAVGACRSVRRIEPVSYLADNAPPVVWVTDSNNAVVQVAEPEVRRDTLRGTLDGARVKIPLGEIRSVEAKVKDGMKTALLVTTLGVAVVSGLYFGFISQAGSNTSDHDCGLDHNGDPIQDC